MVASPAQDVERMFAKLAAFGTLALLMTAIPAVQAAPLDCVLGYNTTGYTGPLDRVARTVENLDGCSFSSDSARPGFPGCELDVMGCRTFQQGPHINDAPQRTRDASCLNLVAEPSPDPIAQPLTFPCRPMLTPEPGPEPMSQPEGRQVLQRQQVLPGIPKEPMVCKLDVECRSLQGISVQ